MSQGDRLRLVLARDETVDLVGYHAGPVGFARDQAGDEPRLILRLVDQRIARQQAHRRRHAENGDTDRRRDDQDEMPGEAHCCLGGQAGAQDPHRQGHDRREGEKPDHGIEIDPERKLGPAYRADHGLGPVDEFGHADDRGRGGGHDDDQEIARPGGQEQQRLGGLAAPQMPQRGKRVVGHVTGDRDRQRERCLEPGRHGHDDAQNLEGSGDGIGEIEQHDEGRRPTREHRERATGLLDARRGAGPQRREQQADRRPDRHRGQRDDHVPAETRRQIGRPGDQYVGDIHHHHDA